MPSRYYRTHDDRELSAPPVLVPCETCGRPYPLTVEDAADQAPQLCIACVRRAVLRPWLQDVLDDL